MIKLSIGRTAAVVSICVMAVYSFYVGDAVAAAIYLGVGFLSSAINELADRMDR